MNTENETSFEDLNFFIDNELTRSDRLNMLDVLKNNDELSKTVNNLQRNDELVYLSYCNIPEPKYNPYIAVTKQRNKRLLTTCAGILVALSFYSGWQANIYINGIQPAEVLQQKK